MPDVECQRGDEQEREDAAREQHEDLAGSPALGAERMAGSVVDDKARLRSNGDVGQDGTIGMTGLEYVYDAATVTRRASVPLSPSPWAREVAGTGRTTSSDPPRRRFPQRRTRDRGLLNDIEAHRVQPGIVHVVAR